MKSEKQIMYEMKWYLTLFGKTKVDHKHAHLIVATSSCQRAQTSPAYAFVSIFRAKI